MSRHGAALCTCCFLALLLPLCAQDHSADTAIWTGTSGNYEIEWSAATLRATRIDTKEIAFDARADAQAAWARIMQRSSGAPLKAEFTYRLLSVEGPYLTFEEEEYCDCGGAHPTAVKRFRAIQLDQSKSDSLQPANLTELFSPEAIHKALVADSLVRKALGSEATPGSLQDLLEQLVDQRVKVRECEYSFPSSLMSSFAVYDVLDESVLVRLGLPAAAESCRGQLSQIGIALSLPEATRASLLTANKQHQGLLMAEADRTMRSKVTSFRFSHDRGH